MNSNKWVRFTMGSLVMTTLLAIPLVIGVVAGEAISTRALILIPAWVVVEFLAYRYFIDQK